MCRSRSRLFRHGAILALVGALTLPVSHAQARDGGGWHGGGRGGWHRNGNWHGGGWHGGGWRGGGWSGFSFGFAVPPLYYAPPVYTYPPPAYYPPPPYASYPWVAPYGYAPAYRGEAAPWSVTPQPYGQPTYGGPAGLDPNNCGTPDEPRPCR